MLAASPPAERLASLDAYRGLAMLLMLGEALRLQQVSDAVPDSGFWRFLAYHQTHVAWAGCSLHDLIQPGFTFMVGVSLPFSIAARLGRGQSKLSMTLHAAWRSAVLVLLGVFLRSLGKERTNFTFDDTLTQIGLGYTFLFLLGLRPVRDQLIALTLILVGYWAAFALSPLPGPEFDRTAVGMPADWPHDYEGFAAHWNKNANPAWAFDRWWMNLFPRDEPWRFHPGGYATLSFVPTLGTMLLGLLAGRTLRSRWTPTIRTAALLLAAAACFGLAVTLDATGVCPIVKRIWTPAWVLFSGGWCFVTMAALYAVMDVKGWKRWAFPLVVVGMNSIAAYCLDWLAAEWVGETLVRHFGSAPFRAFGEPYEPFLLGAATLLVLWLILFWMSRRRVFLRI